LKKIFFFGLNKNKKEHRTKSVRTHSSKTNIKKNSVLNFKVLSRSMISYSYSSLFLSKSDVIVLVLLCFIKS